MSIISIMMQSQSRAGTFVVDNTAPAVALNYGADRYLESSEGKAKFTFSDNIQLLSVGCRLPYGFEFAPNGVPPIWYPPNIELHFERVSDGIVFTQNKLKSFWLPFENYELNMGIVVEPPTAISSGSAEQYRILMKLVTPAGNQQAISMLGVPDSLNDLVIAVPIFAKILHTLDLGL